MDRAELLERAKQTVTGDREQDYGSPEDNFGIIAELWAAYKDDDFTAEDVAAMMILLKVARIAGKHSKLDNWVDIAGYAACGGELESEMPQQIRAKGKTEKPAVFDYNEYINAKYRVDELEAENRKLQNQLIRARIAVAELMAELKEVKE